MAKTKREKKRHLLMAANGAPENWVAVAEITPRLREKILRMRKLVDISEGFGLSLAAVTAHDGGVDFYQPKVGYDGSYEVTEKKPKFKEEFAQQTSCDELHVSETEFWWTCYDKYDMESRVITTERVKIKALDEEDDTPLEEQAITLTQKLENSLHSIVLSKKTDNVNEAYRGALLIAKGNLEAEIAGVDAEMEGEGQ